MNQGVSDSRGRVTGVIHKIFVKEENETGEGICKWVEGCHDVFKNETTQENEQEQGEDLAQLIIVGGDDLQERKRMLVKDADALIVLPGGTGTFDELWEMACSKQIGFIDMPIVCVNIDGYYDPFVQMLKRAHEDDFLYKHPNDILLFETTSEKAVQRVEQQVLLAKKNKRERHGDDNDDGTCSQSEEDDHVKKRERMPLKRKPSMLNRMMSVFNIPSNTMLDVDGQEENEEEKEDYVGFSELLLPAMTFVIGISLGLLSQSKKG